MLSTPSPLSGQFAVKRDENQLSTAPYGSDPLPSPLTDSVQNRKKWDFESVLSRYAKMSRKTE